MRAVGAVALGAATGLAGCSAHVSVHVHGGDSISTITNRPTTITTSTPTYPPSETFTQHDWHVHFRAPRSFSIGHDSADRAAAVLLIGRHDFIELSRYTGAVSAPVTNQTLYRQKERLDRVLSNRRHPHMSGTGNSIDGLPALTYPPVPADDSPPGTTARLAYLWSGRVEYKVLCSATPAHRAQVFAACDEVLATITVPQSK